MRARLKISAANVLAASIGWLGRAPGRLRILAFHDASDDSGDLFAVTKRHFGDYLSLLRDEGYVTIRARDLLSGWPGVWRRERVVLLTFDDGYVAQRDIVADMLERHGMTATFFVISSFLRSERTRSMFAGKERTFLSGGDLRQMDLAGFEIGSHTHTHPLCGTLSETQVEQEFVVSKHMIEQELRHSITGFAYPYGRQCAFSRMTRTVLQRNRYQTAFTLEGIRLGPTCDLLRLPRTSVDRLDTTATFRRKLEGHYDMIGNVRRYAEWE